VSAADLLLEDGSWLVVVEDGSADGEAEAEIPPPPESDASTPPALLGAVTDFVMSAVGAGVLANLTYDVLRSMAADIRDRFSLAPPPEATAEDVADAVERFCARSGYRVVRISEVVGDDRRGWTLRGEVDTEALYARADPSGLLVHVRIG
jgi:hypothetical protein